MVPKGLLTFLGILGNAEFSPWERLPEFTELRKSWKKVCVCFCDCQWWFLFVWKKIVCAIPVRVMKDQYQPIIISTSIARPTIVKNQGNHFSQYSEVTNGWLVSSSAYFQWNMTLKYKMKLSEGSWDKILHSKLGTVFLKGRNIFSGGFGFVSWSDRQSSRSSFCDFFVNTTKES